MLALTLSKQDMENINDHLAKCLDNSRLIENGMLKIIELKHKRKLISVNDTSLIVEAVFYKKKDIIEFFLSKGYRYSPYAMDIAAKNNDLDIVAFLSAYRLKGPSNAFMFAVENGNLDMLVFFLTYHPDKCNIELARRLALRTQNVQVYAFLNQ